MNIDINNLDMAYTIDTYGMFNGDNFDESELDYYKDEYNLTDNQLQLIQFDYDHAGIVKDLANKSIALLEQELKGDIVKSIDYVKSSSPRFYNYTTDSYIATWNIDVDKLIEFINKDTPSFASHLVEIWREFVNVPKQIDKSFLDDDDKILVAMLDYYTRQEYPEDDYNQSMWEYEMEVYCNNSNLTPEAQVMIDKQIKLQEAQ